MAGTYTRKEFTLDPPEEQTLLKDANGTRIIPLKGIEPVRLSPGWEGTDHPDYELNFKGMTMDQADLELNPPKDRFKLVYMVLLLHGIGVLMPWNMFVTAENYFTGYKLEPNHTDVDPYYQKYFPTAGMLANQVPSFFFNWINVFVQFGGSLTTRIVCGIILQIFIYLLTIVLAMIDTTQWTVSFYWITLFCIFVVGTGNGVYQNSIYGMAAKLPPKYTGAVVLGSNLSGTVVSLINLLTIIAAPDSQRTSAIYYFITALFVLLACFDSYFALPINRFYRYHELVNHRETNKKQVELKPREAQTPPYFQIFKQCWVQCFNTFFIFFITLTLFPGVILALRRSDDFIVPAKYYQAVMCFLIFNVMAMLGSFVTSFVQWPSKKYLIIPVVLRVLYVPLYLICKSKIESHIPTLITNDWIYLLLTTTMGFTSGYLSSLSMMYCSKTVEGKHAATAGMIGAAFLITGICAGIISAAFLVPLIVTNIDFI